MKHSLIFSLVLCFTWPTVSLLAQVPTAPQNLTAAVSDQNQNFKKVTLNWDAVEPTSGQRNIYYKVYRKDGDLSSSQPFEVIHPHTNFTFYIDRPIKESATFCYYVTANENKNESSPSNTVEVPIEIEDGGEKGFIAGNVRDDSNQAGIAQARLFFIPHQWSFPTRTETDSTGYFIVEAEAGNYAVHTTAIHYFSEFYDNAGSVSTATIVAVPPGDTIFLDIALTAKNSPITFSLSGKVMDTLAQAVPSTLHAFCIASYDQRGPKHAVAQTDDDGAYQFSFNQGDTVIILAIPRDKTIRPEYYQDQYDITEATSIAINGDISGIDFIVAGPTNFNNQLSGRILNDSLQGVYSWVTAYRLTDRNRRNFKYSINSDSNGHYELTNLDPGPYIVRAIPQDGYRPSFYRIDQTTTVKWKEADTVWIDSASQIDSIDISVDPCGENGLASIGGSILFPTLNNLSAQSDSNETAGIMVYAFNSNQYLTAFTFTDELGDYSIQNLPPDSYRLIIDKVGYENDSRENIVVDYFQNISQSVDFSLIPTSINTDQQFQAKKDIIVTAPYPNPFNQALQIRFVLLQKEKVTVTIFNLLGEKITELISQKLNSGEHTVEWQAGQLPAGIYFCHIQTAHSRITAKLLLLK